MEDKSSKILLIIAIIVVLSLFVLPEGRCAIKGGRMIDDYSNIQECHSQAECSQYKSRVCIKEDGNIINNP